MSEHSHRIVLALLLVLAAAGAALAKPLDELRSEGVVGERFDGLAVARAEHPPEDVVSLLERVNAERGAIYARRAAETDADPAQVGRVYAKEIFERAPKGTWFLQENGTWLRK